MKFNVTILGSGAATPTLKRFPTSQLVNCNEKYILIDCGEGSQIQLRKFKQKFQKISLILISHLHGDHYFGLAGLISSFVLLGRSNKLKIICPKGLKNIILSQIELGNAKIPFEIEFEEIELDSKVKLFEDSLLEVYGFPLNHRIQTHGFEIREKKRARNFIKYQLEELKITVKEIGEIKNGQDLIRDGQIVPIEKYSTDSPEPLSYTYCSDNRILEKQIPYIENTDLLYHEATFLHSELERAKKTYHSTSKEVGLIASKAKLNNVLLGHFSARYDSTTEHQSECQDFIKNVFCIEDGDTYEISENGVKILG